MSDLLHLQDKMYELHKADKIGSLEQVDSQEALLHEKQKKNRPKSR